MNPDETIIAAAYRGFNARDIDAVLALFSPDVDWPNGMEGSRVHGHEAVRVYWLNQWAVVSPQVDPVAMHPVGPGVTIVDVHQVVHDLSGKLLGDVMLQHVYTIRDGLIEHMQIRDAEGRPIN